MRMYNSIVWGNTSKNGSDGKGAPDLGTNGVPTIVACEFDDPLFADAAHGDYRLVPRKSPGYKKGRYDASWMAASSDLDGGPRATKPGKVDLGCYESVWRPGGLMLLVR